MVSLIGSSVKRKERKEVVAGARGVAKAKSRPRCPLHGLPGPRSADFQAVAPGASTIDQRLGQECGSWTLDIRLGM